MNIVVKLAQRLFLASAGLALSATMAAASSNAEVNLTFPGDSRPLTVSISSTHSRMNGWRPNEQVRLTGFIEQDGIRVRLKDREGRRAWRVRLDEQAEGEFRIDLSEESPSGHLEIRANGRYLPEAADASGSVPGRFSEKIHEYRYPDGTRLKVHYTDQSLAAHQTPATFASSVLDAAVGAYQTLTQFEGFNTPGYSFASPDRAYAYDPDQTIDIYIGDGQGERAFDSLGPKNRLFRDAPCFDTVKRGRAEYDAVIFLPANYEEFIRNWEKINPSSLGKRNVHVDLRGTLIHEMTHVILFYYNRNLDKSGHEATAVQEPPGSHGKHLDWYVEGLARYFETFAGARHDFFSQGFKQTLPDKIRFSRGGSNYFMRYPDQAFIQLRYENALFWRFMDYRFGMETIEQLSRQLRGNRADFKQALERVTGTDFETLLEEFAAAVLLADFGLKDDGVYLNQVARTRLVSAGGVLHLLDGADKRLSLGSTSRTDWIGRWEEARASFGDPGVAGDSSPDADVAAWATDYIEFRFDAGGADRPDLLLRHGGAGAPLRTQLFLFTRGGSLIQKAVKVPRTGAVRLGLPLALAENGLTADDIERLVLAVTNSDPERSARYDISLLE